MPPSQGRGIAVRTNLWLWPLIASAAAVGLAFVTTGLDRRNAKGSITYPDVLMFGSDDDVRAVLTTVASSTITVVTLLASLTLVAVSLSATALGPRRIRAYVRDPYIKATVAAFVGTFVFALVVLLLQRSGDAGYVQHLSGITAILLSIGCVLLFAFFLNHLAIGLTPTANISVIFDELSKAAQEWGQGRSRYDRAHRTTLSDGELAASTAHLQGEGEPIRARVPGYIQIIRFNQLVEACAATDAVVEFRKRPGEFLMRDETIAVVHGGGNLEDVFVRAIDIRPFRTLRQDLEFAIDQVVEIAIRALSPAINDSFTGIICVDWLGELLRVLATAAVGTPVHHDSSGTVRVVMKPLRFASATKSAFDKIRQAAASNPAVLIRMLEVIERLAPVVPADEHRQALRRQVEAIEQAATAHLVVTIDRSDVARRYERALRALEAAPAAQA